MGGVLLVLVAIALAATSPYAQAQAISAKAADQLMDTYYCSGCHDLDRKVVGPAFRDVAKKYAGDANAPATLALKVRRGGQGVWGIVPMPANEEIPETDLAALISWILALR